VNDYNDEILYDVAELQFDNEGYSYDPSMERDEAILELQRGLWDEYSYNSFYYIDDYVYKFLIEEKLMFIIPDSYFTYSSKFPNEDIVIIANDCMNILFPSFLRDFKYEVAPYYPEMDYTLTVWEGLQYYAPES
jgi:hypothetical protein